MISAALKRVLSIPRTVVLATIRFYQKTFSPDHGWCRAFFPFGCCRFHPTCSQYAHQAIEEFGLARGLMLSTWRLLRCHPWSRGGHDPVPPRKK